jgi:hypothetical protein
LIEAAETLGIQSTNPLSNWLGFDYQGCRRWATICNLWKMCATFAVRRYGSFATAEFAFEAAWHDDNLSDNLSADT